MEKGDRDRWRREEKPTLWSPERGWQGGRLGLRCCYGFQAARLCDEPFPRSVSPIKAEGTSLGRYSTLAAVATVRGSEAAIEAESIVTRMQGSVRQNSIIMMERQTYQGLGIIRLDVTFQLLECKLDEALRLTMSKTHSNTHTHKRDRHTWTGKNVLARPILWHMQIGVNALLSTRRQTQGLCFPFFSFTNITVGGT